MARQKKIKTIQMEEKIEGKMSGEIELESLQTEIDLARVELEKTRKEIAEKKSEIELMAKRDITKEEIKIIEKQITNSVKNDALKEKIESQKAYDNERVTGRFMNRRAPGQAVKLPYHKYPDDPIKWYPFEDGKVYTIQRGFADQINGGDETNPCYYTPKFAQKEGAMDPDRPESQIHHVDTSNKKYAFVPVNF